MNKILSIGQVVVDQILNVNEFPKNGEKVEPISTKLDLGGTACSVAVLLAKFKIKSTLIARIGKDALGKFAIKKLKYLGVHFEPQWTSHTLINHVIVDKKSGQRTIIKDKEGGKKISKIPAGLINKVNFIFCDRHEPVIFKKLIGNKPQNSKIIIDSSSKVSKKTIFMIQKADYPIIPIEFVHNFNPNQKTNKTLEEIGKLVKKNFWVTLGNNGSLMYLKKKSFKKIEAFKVNVVDCLGAGDVYRGAFIYGLTQNWPLLKIMKFANAAGGLQCTRLGNISAIPSEKEVKKLYE